MENLRWIAAAALSAYAGSLAVHHATPIDAALPFLIVAVTFLAWLSYPAVMLAAPMLILGEIAVADEPLRLLCFGGIVAAAAGVAVARGQQASAIPGAKASWGNIVLAAVCIVILRWIPIEEVLLGREIFLLLISAATVAVLGRTPFAVTVAVVTALVTPAVPMRTLLVPVTVFALAALARFFGMPRVRLAWPSTVTLLYVMLFFPWSGIVARAFPYFLREAAPERPRTVVAQALAPDRSEVYTVPDGATHLVVSGANVAHLRRGAILGRLDPGRRVVRIGDGSDWGYLRRGAWYRAHNPLPRDPAGKIREYGYSAWVDGAGRIPLPRGVRTIRVTADAKLPANASLQVEGFE